MPKPIILTFVGCYLPGYKSGGPVRTIANMVDQLGDELDFRIVTADRDFNETKPYRNVVIDGWNTVGNAKVFYVSPKKRSVKSLTRLINETPHDVLYLNSFFDPGFTIRPLLARYFGLIQKKPTVVAPRGQFSKGALALKPWKKRTYLTAVKALRLYSNVIWQASSEYEAEDIRRVMGSSLDQIVVAPNLPAAPNDFMDEEQQKDRGPGEPLRVCFLSRISPKKNLDYALRVLSEVTVPVEFTIYGVMEDEPYWQDCQKLIKRLPPHVVVRYHGAIDHANVPQALAQHDLFFFPTRGENYGHVIHEALSAGLPVLLSDQTPWRNLEALGVGWDLPLNAAEKFRAVIEAQAALSCEVQAEQRRITRQYADIASQNKKVVSDNIVLFTNLLAKNKTV